MVKNWSPEDKALAMVLPFHFFLFYFLSNLFACSSGCICMQFYFTVDMFFSFILELKSINFSLQAHIKYLFLKYASQGSFSFCNVDQISKLPLFYDSSMLCWWLLGTLLNSFF